jgi:trimethylamine--corrinoid protein Co-methyltransferase
VPTSIQVLQPGDCDQIHERSLKVLKETGVRIMSGRAREILRRAGAEVEPTTERVRFSREIVEQSLRQAPPRFQLGGRRPDWSLDMNSGGCWMVADGGAVSTLDPESGDVRPGTYDDWQSSTLLVDAIEEIGVYWTMVEGGFDDTAAGYVKYWRSLLASCSKHIQDSVETVEQGRLLIEILDIVFGGKEGVRQAHPFSYVLCPMSPLAIDATYTDAWLETVGWEIPVAIMPMPLMGATAPASPLSALLVANVEFLASFCLVQAASPRLPVLYAPVPHSVEPRSWRYTGGAIENSALGAGVTAMGRYYGLPVEASAGGTDQYRPGAQAAYERALNWSLPILSWPDLLVGPGLLAGSTLLSLDQMLLDVEVFRRCARMRQGISTGEDAWFDELISSSGPGANFVGQKSTLKALRAGDFYLGKLGFHGTLEEWQAAGKPDVLDELAGARRSILQKHQPVLLDNALDRELERLERRAED